jgi:hypothetical protein
MYKEERSRSKKKKTAGSKIMKVCDIGYPESRPNLRAIYCESLSPETSKSPSRYKPEKS